MQYLPISLAVDGQQIIVVGNGHAAHSKLQVLVKTAARLMLFADSPEQELRAFASTHGIELRSAPLGADEVKAACLVYLADVEISDRRRIRQLCKDHGTLVNVVDDAGSSDFISPAIVDRDPLVIAIGTEGSSPVLARLVKKRLEGMLDSRLGEFCRVAAKIRPLLRTRLAPALQRTFWQAFFERLDSRWLSSSQAPRQLRAHLEQNLRTLDDAQHANGTVSLVGAGPGDPELLTLRARQRLDQADVIFYDRLVDQRVLDLARREARFIGVGKELGGGGWQQQEINTALVDYARKGLNVVRLKSGDPLVFGRADEELDTLENAGIDAEIVPGISAAIAAAGEIGRSLTRRGRNSALSFLTGHDFKGFAEQNWRSLAQSGQTAAIYMGIRAARFFQGRLLVAGANPNTPMTIVENASRPEQRVFGTTIGRLCADLEQNRVKGPAIIFLGLTPRASAVEQSQQDDDEQLAMFTSEFTDPRAA